MTKRTKTKTRAESAFERLRAICYGFPGVEEKLSYGAPSFHVRNKSFVTFDGGAGGAVHAMCKLDLERQRELVATDPERFHVPAYFGAKGWVSVRLDSPSTDWEELTILVEEAWSAVVPPKVALAPVRPPPPPLAVPTTDPAVAKTAHAKVDALCRALSGTSSETSHRHTTYYASKKVVAYFLDNHHGDAIVGVVVKALSGENTALVATAPDRYYMPAYVGARGWVGIRLDHARVDWKDVEARIIASHEMATVRGPARAKPRTSRTRSQG